MRAVRARSTSMCGVCAPSWVTLCRSRHCVAPATSCALLITKRRPRAKPRITKKTKKTSKRPEPMALLGSTQERRDLAQDVFFFVGDAQIRQQQLFDRAQHFGAALPQQAEVRRRERRPAAQHR